MKVQQVKTDKDGRVKVTKGKEVKDKPLTNLLGDTPIYRK